MDLGGGRGHLTYSTLVHPGDTWEEMWASLAAYVPRVKARVAPTGPFGVSLRLSASSAARLVEDRAARDRLRGFLADNDLYLYTVNAFPYGAFKGRKVKEEVYEPDWRSEERVRYTTNVADILADVTREDVQPSIQSPPLGFKPRVTGPEVVAAYTRQVLRVVAHLIDLEHRTGRTITLGLEPEPYCLLETTDEAIAYFTEHLYAASAAEALATRAGMRGLDAETALRRHVGVVFDICHQAVEYEDIPQALRKLAEARIPIVKLQAAAALRVPEVTPATIEALAPFADTVYLTQTFEKRDGRITGFLNLEDAFDAWRRSPGPREWRTHIHVPVFLGEVGPLRTTRFAIEDALHVHRTTPVSPQLEIETYTWDVLPASAKTGDVVDSIAREIEWVRGRLL